MKESGESLPFLQEKFLDLYQELCKNSGNLLQWHSPDIKTIVMNLMMTEKKKDYWAEIRKEFSNELLSLGIPKKIAKNELVFLETDPYEGFFEVVTGIFKVYSLSPEGKEAILKVFYPGELIASYPVFQPTESNSYPAFCESLKEGELLFYPKKEFLNFLNGNTKAMFLFSSANIQHLVYFRKKMMDNLYLSVKDRIFSFLQECGAVEKHINLPITKNQLASLLGTTPESVSRAFRSLLEEGSIEEKDSCYKILHEIKHPVEYEGSRSY